MSMRTADYRLWTVDYGVQTAYLEGSMGFPDCEVYTGELLEGNEDSEGPAYSAVVTNAINILLLRCTALLSCA